MSRFRLPKLDEAGIASTVAVLVLTAMMIFAATVFSRSIHLGNSTVKTNNGQRAFDAADAGLDMAVRRLTFLQPPASSCVTTTVASPAGGGWCAQTPEESIGRGETFSYRVSTSPVPGGQCAGAPSPAGTTDRCIVAIGRANGEQRRLETRVAMRGGTMDPIFYMGSAFGNELLRVETGATIQSDVTTNGKFEVRKSPVINGTVKLGPNAKTRGWTGPVQRLETNASVATPDFGNTATVNNNGSLPATAYNAQTRTLTIAGNKQVSLAPGVYNFCKIVISGRGILNAGGRSASPVRIFLDSPERQNSGCPPKSGTMTSAKKGGITNPSLDPTALEINAYGTTKKKGSAKLTIPLRQKGTLAAAVVAPNSDVRFSEPGVFVGGVAGKRVIFKQKMRFLSDTRIASYTTTTVPTTFRLAWRQCRSAQDPVDPHIGCQ